MSLCTIGFAAEFGARGVAANSLWPATTIATAAVEVFFAEALAYSRTPAIMADAAHLILTRDSRAATGQFFVDETVLREAGLADFDQYAVTPDAVLRRDIFLD
jgi:citronellol/citronellal dehydrogenase